MHGNGNGNGNGSRSSKGAGAVREQEQYGSGAYPGVTVGGAYPGDSGWCIPGWVSRVGIPGG